MFCHLCLDREGHKLWEHCMCLALLSCCNCVTVSVHISCVATSLNEKNTGDDVQKSLICNVKKKKNQTEDQLCMYQCELCNTSNPDYCSKPKWDQGIFCSHWLTCICCCWCYQPCCRTLGGNRKDVSVNRHHVRSVFAASRRSRTSSSKSKTFFERHPPPFLVFPSPYFNEIRLTSFLALNSDFEGEWNTP